MRDGICLLWSTRAEEEIFLHFVADIDLPSPELCGIPPLLYSFLTRYTPTNSRKLTKKKAKRNNVYADNITNVRTNGKVYLNIRNRTPDQRAIYTYRATV